MQLSKREMQNLADLKEEIEVTEDCEADYIETILYLIKTVELLNRRIGVLKKRDADRQNTGLGDSY